MIFDFDINANAKPLAEAEQRQRRRRPAVIKSVSRLSRRRKFEKFHRGNGSKRESRRSPDDVGRGGRGQGRREGRQLGGGGVQGDGLKNQTRFDFSSLISHISGLN